MQEYMNLMAAMSNSRVFVKNATKYDGYVADNALVYRYANHFRDIEPNLMVSNYNVRNISGFCIQ